MSELAELYALFVVIYLLECAEWLPVHASAFVGGGKRWRVRKPHRINASWKKGVVFGRPWPPLSPPIVAEPVPVSMGKEGWVDQGGFHPWVELENVQTFANAVAINGAGRIELSTRRGARALAATMKHVAGQRPELRAATLIQFLRGRHQVSIARERLAAAGKDTRVLLVSTITLWLTLFVGVPLGVMGALPALIPALALTLLAWLVAAIAFERAVRRRRDDDRDQRPDLLRRVVTVSSPITVLRAMDALAHETVGDLDPAAVAAATLDVRALGVFVRPRLAALRFADMPTDNAEEAASTTFWNAQLQAQLEALLREHGIDSTSLMAAPPPHGPDVVAYCPVCLEQFVNGHPHGQSCPNETCPDITLLAYPTPAT